MPYKKRYTKKRNGRPGYRACGKMVYSDAAKALAMAKYLKGVVNVEFKNHDIQATSDALAITPAITQLTNIAIGDTTNTRDGSNLKLVSLLFNYTLISSASAVSTHVRVMLVHDRQTNEAIYAIADLLADTSANDNIVSPRNLDNGHRFNVLYDRVHSLSVGGNSTKNYKFFKKLQLKIRYDNAAAAITSLTQSSLSLVTMTNEPTNVPVITHNIRLRYVDN